MVSLAATMMLHSLAGAIPPMPPVDRPHSDRQKILACYMGLSKATMDGGGRHLERYLDRATFFNTTAAGVRQNFKEFVTYVSSDSGDIRHSQSWVTIKDMHPAGANEMTVWATTRYRFQHRMNKRWHWDDFTSDTVDGFRLSGDKAMMIYSFDWPGPTQ